MGNTNKRMGDTSSSMQEQPNESKVPATMMSNNLSSTVTLGAGCYWGTERYIKTEFQKRFPNSIKSARVGFMSPEQNHKENPSYREVCTGRTGHVEVLHVELNDPDAHFEELMKFFYLFHDPTTLNKQGNDKGTQYASVVFLADEKQKQIAEKVKNDLQEYINTKKSPYSGKTIVTKIHDATKFYEAEEYHQEYLAKNPSGYCNHFYRMKNWPLTS